ncbi:MAG: winged helix DNA-binding protein [Beijerinckiaceae bacterium]|nr:winged helix DNA-binding protein [Beijerinckiaceae bacterium]
MGKTPVPLPLTCNNDALRKATRRLGQLFDDILQPSGLRATQSGLLRHIKQLNGPTMTQLADELVMDLSALGHTLKPLARDGYITLTPDARDRRAKRVKLTASGEAKVAETELLWRIAQTRFEAAFGQRKAEKFRKTLALLASSDFTEAFHTATKINRKRHAPGSGGKAETVKTSI